VLRLADERSGEEAASQRADEHSRFHSSIT
jgi:hypothetical protein